MGLGLFTAIQITGFTHKFYFIIAILALIVGVFNIKDYFWYGKGFLMEVPLNWRPKMKKMINGVTSPIGAFFVGFVVSLFLLPCTSGPYIVILGLLAVSQTKLTGIMYLLLYNLIFISPMIVITLLLYRGLSTVESLESIRQKKLKTLHLVAGIIMVLMGLGILLAMHFGML